MIAQRQNIEKNRQDGSHPDQGVRLTVDELLALRRDALGLDLTSRYRVSSTLAGGYRSKFRGRGMDFDEVRTYQPGDDIRNIDWRVTARTGKPHTKLFKEERERPVFLLIDQSKHLFFGSRNALKSVVAARAASLLVWASINAGSRIGGILFDEEGHLEHRPSGRRRDALALLKKITHRHNQVVDHMLEQTPEDYAQTDRSAFADALSRLRRVAKPGSLIYLFSDFRYLDDDCHRHLSRLGRHCEMLAYPLTDPLDKDLPPPGNYALTDGQDIRRFNTSSGKMRERYHDLETERLIELDEYFIQQRISSQTLDTTDQLAVILAGQNLPKVVTR